MLKVYIKKQGFHANGIYEDGTITILKGSTINSTFASYIKGISFAKECRENPNIVDNSWTLLQDCTFPSPSTAAQFVMGQSRDGYDAWKVKDGLSLGKYLEQKGIRFRKQRK